MTPPPRDELTTTVFDALQNLVPTQKATFLLDTALALIAVGQCVYSTEELATG